MSNLIKKISAVIFALAFVAVFCIVGSMEQDMLPYGPGMVLAFGILGLMAVTGYIGGAFEVHEIDEEDS